MSDDDKPRPFDIPLVNDAGSQPFGQPVVSFGDIRIAHGLTRHPHRLCEHKTLVYSREERRIWCETCERTLDAFDAFMMVVRYFQDMERACLARFKDAEEARNATLIRRAAKHIDRVWGRGMLPQCPQCGRGITPDEMLRAAEVGLGYEMARRAKKENLP